MDDILHYSLKVTHHPKGEKKKGPTAEQIPKIARLEHSDIQLYTALNKTFHEKLAKQGPQFHADVKLFRDRKAEIFDRWVQQPSQMFDGGLFMQPRHTRSVHSQVRSWGRYIRF